MQPNLLLSIIDPVFKKKSVSLPKNTKDLSINTDDFGLETSRLLLSKEIEERRHSLIKSCLIGKPVWEGITFFNTPKNLKAIASALGISINDSSSFYYVRDQFIRLSDSTIKMVPFSSSIEIAVKNTHSHSLYAGKSAATHTTNQLFNHWGGFAAHHHAHSLVDREQFFMENCTFFSYAYVEGGNVLTLTNLQNEIQVLIGEDHRFHTLLLLELEEKDWGVLAREASLGKSLADVSMKFASVSDENLHSAAEEMFSLGLTSHLGKTGIIKEEDQLPLLLKKYYLNDAKEESISENSKNWFKEMAIESGIIPSFEMQWDAIKEKRPILVEYLAKLEIVDVLIAKDFGIAPQNVHYITQVNYHLDTFLASAPCHGIFVMDYGFCADLLEALLQSSEILGLSELDKYYLRGYLRASRKLEIELAILLAQVRQQIRAAGFLPIPMPGHWVHQPEEIQQFPMPTEGFSINFINSLTGWSSKIHKPYYITHGLHVGDRLGTYIMEVFRLYLRHYIPNVEVFYIGHSPEIPTDFSEALDFWNRMETQSGIHCATFPLDSLRN